MNIHYLFNLIILITNSIFLKKFLHIFQLKDYNNTRYLKYFINKKIIFIFICLILFIFQIIFKNLLFFIISNTIILIFNIIFCKFLIKSNKTPIKFTKKIKRLYFLSFILIAVLSFYKFSFCLFPIVTLLCPIISNFINIYDKIKNKLFIDKARKKLKSYKTKIIAITGSNGKTSVKNILKEIISTQRKTQATPASYNTPLGISKFINEHLERDCEFLILEYGARHKNDIKKLCKLFGADYGIVTTISPQHLETFKNIENIMQAKNQLPIYLQNKPCVFNIDNIYCKRMFDLKHGNKISTSIYSPANVHTKNFKINNCQIRFDLILNDTIHTIKTNLLGKHNISNICLATALSLELSISIENIISAIENLQPTEHRLSLIKTYINILDDSYNCSPTSAKEALWVLKNFSGKKMIATPGIIECGKEAYSINYNLGKEMSFCNWCIIVGEHNKKAILDGLKSQNYNTKNIILANTLDDAKRYFSKLKDNDTLLLLNDLPDDYN